MRLKKNMIRLNELFSFTQLAYLEQFEAGEIGRRANKVIDERADARSCADGRLLSFFKVRFGHGINDSECEQIFNKNC